MDTLFWALFGLPDMSVVDFTSAVDAEHYFTETVGNFLYATYHVIAIVVLLNVLIAMMSNTYTRVEVGFNVLIYVTYNMYFISAVWYLHKVVDI